MMTTGDHMSATTVMTTVLRDTERERECVCVRECMCLKHIVAELHHRYLLE